MTIENGVLAIALTPLLFVVGFCLYLLLADLFGEDD